jgi:sigma-B regulation protein RsbU (phosphoserine phosphatase)
MGGERHMTLALLRVRADGHVVLAGAHTELVLLRAGAARCEIVSTPGTFLGVLRDVDAVTVESRLDLQPGDLLVSCTDGVTEAMNAAGEQFGDARLCDAVLAARAGSAASIVDAVVAATAAWRVRQDDDVTVLVMRYRGDA